MQRSLVLQQVCREYFQDLINYIRHIQKQRTIEKKKIFFSCRECQVKDWENHKNICDMITKTKQ